MITKRNMLGRPMPRLRLFLIGAILLGTLAILSPAIPYR